MEKFTYLFINIFTIAIPFTLSFEKKVGYYKKWKFLFPSIMATAVVFLVWDYFKTKHGVWQFNDSYILGVRFFGLPLEEYLFFITIPYSCMFIYEVLNYYIAKPIHRIIPVNLVWFISLMLLLLSFVFLNKTYTWSVLFGAAFVLPALAHRLNGVQFQNFFLAFIISIIPMLLVNGVLTALPVVIYNDAENTGIRFTTMPVEDLLYNLILLGMNIGIYEWLRSRSVKINIGKELPVVQLY